MTIAAESPPTTIHTPTFKRLYCEGERADGGVCNRVLLEIGINSHYILKKRCERCGTLNTFRRA